MATIALLARPRLVAAAALLGLTLLFAGEAREPAPSAPMAALDLAPAAEVIAPPVAFADARPWNHGGMVIAPPAPGDRIVRSAVTDLLSGLFGLLRGLAA